MSKKKLLIIAFLVSLFYVQYSYFRNHKKELRNQLNFEVMLSGSNNPHFSLKKGDADFSHNQVFLNAVIGTLVKFGKTGKLEGYLAESWRIENNNLNWIFTFRKNIKDQLGNTITAEKYIEILKNNLFEYQKDGDVISFKYLKGWSSFVKDGRNLDGISVKGNEILFQFEKDPEDLLELLRMPYFGYWLSENDKIISTGSYQVEKFDEKEVKLILNRNSFNITEDSINEIVVKFSTDSKLNISKSTIRKVPFNQPQIEVNDSYWIVSPPTRLEAFVLSPLRLNFFNSLQNRKVFQSKVRNLYKSKIHSLNVFNIGISEILEKFDENLEYKYSANVKKLTFAIERNNYTKSEYNELVEILNFALDNLPFEIIMKKDEDKDWFKKTDSNAYFDSRVTSVDVGAYPDFMILDMMFCSKLGVNFPDINHKICDFVEYGKNKKSKFNDEDLKKFNKIIDDDAIIIPIRHHSDKWLVSGDIDPKTLPPTTLYPQFETIRFVK